MSDQVNVDQRVTELSKPENKAELENVLNQQFNDAVNPAASKTAEGQAPEPKPADITEPKTADPAKPADDGNPQGGDDTKAGEAGKGDRVKDLLKDRNEAKAEAAKAQTEVQTLTKQVQDLTELVQKLASGKGSEGGDGDTPASADDLKGKDLASIVEEIINKREQARSASESAEKSITDAIQALETNPDTPKAKEYAADIKALMEKHPTISAYMAYVALVGSGKIPSEIQASNANRTGTGNRSKTGLTKTVNPSDMSQADLEKHLFSEAAAGNLQGLI